MAIKTLILDTQSAIKENYNELTLRGLSVTIVSERQEILNSLHRIAPDVIIINFTEPEQKIELLYPSIRLISSAPILVLSVVDQPGIVEKELDYGADDYLVKPVSPTLLTARIKALARRSQIHSSHPV